MMTCGTGGGHNTACAAVAQAMAARGHSVRTLNPYTLKSEQVAEVVDKAYILLAQKAPSAFGAAYKLGDAYRKLPFPSPVYRMKACDLYLSKPGGLSSTEAAVVGTALVHITPIPGCETSNMHFFAQNGMSLAVNSPEHELIDACDRLLEAGAREKMIECQHRVIPTDAAGDICALLEEEYAQNKTSG